MPVIIKALTAAQLEQELPRLIALLQDSVAGGSGLGFEPPLSDEEARAYWLSIRAELLAGTRHLLVAYVDDELVGTGQLELAPWSSGQHRAELQKLFVDRAQRGQGIGEALVSALHDTAQRHQRSLIVLNTRCGQPAVHFYKRLGYREAGVIPGFTRSASGERRGTLILYRELADATALLVF